MCFLAAFSVSALVALTFDPEWYTNHKVRLVVLVSHAGSDAGNLTISQGACRLRNRTATHMIETSICDTIVDIMDRPEMYQARVDVCMEKNVAIVHAHGVSDG